ncbi:probable splicing factor, arginine/serine-rich 6 [Acanthaster planci]|uniref:Probable splicing factor, arginine/serine-rich 6 n=1 Tax=Acanthaster planci TaxID=133434 RepID=A0A8B7Y5Y4_ACAPL|nr:probable splicing factor, arginine/serine-rich 6 [Acanthaster planci]
MLTEGRLYVGLLNPDTTKQDIEAEFGRYGSLRDVWMARNPPGFAFIEYDSAVDAERAMRDLDGANLLGSRIKVEPSKGNQRGGRGGRGGTRGGGDRRGGGMRGGSREGSFRGSRGSRDWDSRGGRGPPPSYGSYGDYPARGGGGAYRDEPKARYGADQYGSRYDSAAYRSRSPIRRRSPPPPQRGRDFGGREYGVMSREYGGGRDYGGGTADYGPSARDYASPRSYAPRDGGRDFDREYRAPVAGGGASARYDRGEFDRYSRYDRAPAAYTDRSRRSPLPRR